MQISRFILLAAGALALAPTMADASSIVAAGSTYTLGIRGTVSGTSVLQLTFDGNPETFNLQASPFYGADVNPLERNKAIIVVTESETDLGGGHHTITFDITSIGGNPDNALFPAFDESGQFNIGHPPGAVIMCPPCILPAPQPLQLTTDVKLLSIVLTPYALRGNGMVLPLAGYGANWLLWEDVDFSSTDPWDGYFPTPDQYTGWAGIGGSRQQGVQFPIVEYTLAFTVQEDLAPTPLPAALPLFATGLGALGLIVHRRRRASGRSRMTRSGMRR